MSAASVILWALVRGKRMVDLSIIIVNWNTRNLLFQCLESVYESAGRLNLEVIVVDNASTDGSVEMVQEQFPHVRLVENRKNAGFAAANNQAMRISKGDYICLLNSDTVVLGNALEKAVAFMQSHPDVGALSPRLLNEDGSLQDFPKSYPTLANELSRMLRIYNCVTWSKRKGLVTSGEYTREVDRVKGACLLVQRQVVGSVGGMAEDYFMYAEEDDWCYRIKRQGWKIYYYPEARVVHYGGSSIKQVSHQMFLRLHQSKLLFFRRYYSPTSVWLLRVIWWIGYRVRLAFVSLLWMLGGKASEAWNRKRKEYRALLHGLASW